jgi:putative transposase
VNTSSEPGRRPIRTLRLKVHPDAYAWLNQAAMEVNQVWNYVNATSFKAIRPYFGKPRWLGGFDLCNLTAGATDYLEHIGADTIQRVCVEYARKRRAAKRIRRRWRKSLGARRSLGWVPIKAASLRRHVRYLRFCGKAIRFFESERLAPVLPVPCEPVSDDCHWRCEQRCPDPDPHGESGSGLRHGSERVG